MRRQQSFGMMKESFLRLLPLCSACADDDGDDGDGGHAIFETARADSNAVLAEIALLLC